MIHAGRIRPLIGAAALSFAAPAALATRPAEHPIVPPSAAPAAVPTSGLAGTDPDRRAAARRLLDASGFRARQEAIASDSWQAARALKLADCVDRAGSGRRLDCASTPAQEAKVKAMLQADQERTLDTLGEAAETLYAEKFTSAEMDQLSAFFESDIGQKYSKAYPSILTHFQAAKERILLDAINAAHAKIVTGTAAHSAGAAR